MRFSRVLLGSGCFSLLAGTVQAQPTPPPTKTEFSGEDWVVERGERKTRFENDGTGQHQTTMRVRLLTDAGVRLWGLITLPYDAGTRSMELREVRVLRPGGDTVTPSLAQVQEVTAAVARAAPMYSDYREKHFAVPDLRPGDTLEFTAVENVRTPRAAGQFWYEDSFYRTAIALDEQLEIDVPRDRTLQLRTGPGFVPVISETADRRVYRFTHSMTQLDEVLKVRKLAHRKRGARPDIALSSFKSWEEFGAWYGSLERDRRTPTAEVRAKAAELTRGLTTDLEKTKALYDYVAQSVRYVSLSLGMASVQPHAASETLANGYGDCKDKHTLLAALLASVGIPAYAALIPTSREVDDAVPYLQFDHVITAVPRGKDILWLDTTMEVAPFRWLAPYLRDQQVLLVSPDGPARLARTPAEPVFANEHVIDLNGQVDTNGKLVARQETTFRGDPAVFLRAVLRLVPRDQWPQIMEKATTSMAEVMNLKAEVVKVSPAESSSTPDVLGWSTDFSIDHIVDSASATTAGFLHLPEWIDRSSPASELLFAFDGELELPGPISHRVHAKIELPAGWSLRPPEPRTISLDFADYRASYHLEQQTLVVDRALEFKTKQIPESRGDEYDQFRSQVSKEPRVVSLSRAADTAKENAAIESERLYKAGVEDFDKQDYQGCVENVKRALELAPNHKDAWNELGRAYLQLRETDRAVSALRKQIEIVPAHQAAFNNLGLALRQAHRDGEAEAAFKKQIEINPQDRYAHRNLGFLLAEQKRYGEAVAELEKAALIEPQNASVQVSLGEAYLGLDQDEKAMAAFDRAVTISPQSQTWNNAAYRLAEGGKHLERAQEWAESAVTSVAARLRAVAPERLGTADIVASHSLSDYWDTLGWIHFRRGDGDGALKYLESAFALRPDPVEADHLGQVYESRNDKERAIHAYALALALSSDRAETRRRLTVLTGGDSQTSEAIEKARADLPGLGHLSVARPGGLEGELSADLLVALGSGGKVLAARPVASTPQADAAAKPLVGIDHGLTFPDATPTQAVRRATLVCPARGGCQLSFAQGNGTAPAIAHVGGTIPAPHKIKSVPPNYPLAAREAGIQGTVVLECTIAPDGRVVNVTVLRGVPELNDDAIAAVRQWVYTPTTLNGIAVPVIMTVTVNFRL